MLFRSIPVLPPSWSAGTSAFIAPDFGFRIRPKAAISAICVGSQQTNFEEFVSNGITMRPTECSRRKGLKPTNANYRYLS